MINFRKALSDRGVVPNSTWLRSDNAEMYVVMADDETIMREGLSEFVSGSAGDLNDTGWVRVVRLPVEGKSFARTDTVFIPFLCGQIDRGIIRKIG